MDNQEYQKKRDLIWHYINIDSMENARRACEDALCDDPTDSWVYKKLAHACYSLDDFEACAQAATKALEYATSSYERASAYCSLALERSAAGDHVKSAAYFKEAVSGQPENAYYLAMYAFELAHLDKQDEAQSLFAKAEEMAPDDYYVLETKFRFYFNFQNDRAIEEETLRRMLPLSTTPFHMNLFMAEFHLKYSEYEAAYDHYIKASLAKPGHERANEMRRKLETKGVGGKKRQEESLRFPKSKVSYLSELTKKSGKDIYADVVQIDDMQLRFERVSLCDGKFSVMLPDSFREMRQWEKMLRYTNVNAPDYIKASDDLIVHFCFSVIDRKESEAKLIKIIKRSRKRLMDASPDSYFSSCLISQTKSKVKFGYFEKTTSLDMDVYSFTSCIPLNNSHMVFSFSAPVEHMQEWQPVVLQVVQSVQSN
jgi:tetratricopeptide (TPR) repeat protein